MMHVIDWLVFVAVFICLLGFCAIVEFAAMLANELFMAAAVRFGFYEDVDAMAKRRRLKRL